MDDPIPSNIIYTDVGFIRFINEPNDLKNPPNPPVCTPFSFIKFIFQYQFKFLQLYKFL